ncbi:MAG: hypothetical protein J0I69_02950 [Altererythrobacter sp.]|nr:hypothetical protein [Altererythrobacter sp.]
MSWRPRLCLIGTAVCEPDGEFEGRTLQVFWHGWVFELTLARRVREIADAR